MTPRSHIFHCYITSHDIREHCDATACTAHLIGHVSLETVIRSLALYLKKKLLMLVEGVAVVCSGLSYDQW